MQLGNSALRSQFVGVGRGIIFKQMPCFVHASAAAGGSSPHRIGAVPGGPRLRALRPEVARLLAAPAVALVRAVSHLQPPEARQRPVRSGAGQAEAEETRSRSAHVAGEEETGAQEGHAGRCHARS